MATKKFVVECEMEERWVNHFLSMLNHMQDLGLKGSSRTVCLFSDGDGDFRPKFATDYFEKFNMVEPKILIYKTEHSQKTLYVYDAG
jgi:hypothetical protein